MDSEQESALLVGLQEQGSYAEWAQVRGVQPVSLGDAQRFSVLANVLRPSTLQNPAVLTTPSSAWQSPFCYLAGDCQAGSLAHMVARDLAWLT